MTRKLFYAIIIINLYLGSFSNVFSPLINGTSLYAQSERTIVVLPFQNITKKKSLDEFSYKIVDQANFLLEHYGVLNVITSKEKLKYFKGIEPDRSGDIVSQEHVNEAKSLSADYILSGTYSGRRSSMNLRIKVIKVKNGRVVLTRSVHGSFYGVLSNMGSTIEDISDNLSKEHSGFLTVNSSPKNAEVYINGDLAGYTPMIKDPLLAGEYQVEIRKKGFHSLNLSTKISNGKVTSINDLLVSKEDIWRWGMGIAGYGLWVPHDDFSITALASVILHVKKAKQLITIDVSYVPKLDHSYEYEAPYTTTIDERYYRLMLVGVSLFHRFKNRHGKAELYIGGRLGALWYSDFRAVDSIDREIDTNIIFTIGPTIGFAFSPNPRSRFFLEVRYTLPVIQINRERLESVNLFGNKDIVNDVMYMQMLSFGGGISAQF